MNEQMLNTLRNYFISQPVEKAWLFGSYARNQQNEDSDIDILVTLDKNKNIGLRFFGMWAELEEILKKKVDLVVDGCLMDFAKESAEKDKTLIYERTYQR